MGKTAKKIKISGLVQGVGFRPFIYRLAIQHHIKGTVENNNTGVSVIAESDPNNLNEFIRAIPVSIPEAASISSLQVSETEFKNFSDFSIVKSNSYSDEITEVSPDISVCKACLEDMKTQPHRIGYPFTNCTNCGPRFTIIKDLPYDRHTTTMAPFTMCPNCRSEFDNILDRRFHAQPVACNHCGPHYAFYDNYHTVENLEEIIDATCESIESGKIIAIKGLGGYHLACDPFNEATVSQLRRRKTREGKPFALMLKDIETVRKYHYLNREEEQSLLSWRKPIVLLKVKKHYAPSVNTGLDTVGVMLPYMPFHYMLFEKLRLPALVLTSGNLSDEPIVIDNEVAKMTLGPVTDGLITYNRDIHNRTDDSVTFVANGTERLIRRSRSYAPSPIHLNLNTEGIFAAGAELVNCFCIGKGNQAILSQHIGDLKNLETLEFYTESAERYQRLFRFRPELAVMDMHPDYLSTRFAQDMDIPLVSVQHHHAHIASCMAEHGLDEKVIGISFDGTGYGTDGNIWGGEFLLCDLADFERMTHFEYIPQPGGDIVTKQPWRMMAAYLFHYFGKEFDSRFPFLFEGIDQKEIEMVRFALKNKLNAPLTSSAGRLFDAVAALLNVCRHSTYHAEAPMRLEAIADKDEKNSYPFYPGKTISMKPAFEAMIKDIKEGVNVSAIAGRFHNTVVELIVDSAKKIKATHHLNKIALSGGTFQNRLILERTEQKLADNGFEVFTQSTVPSNDGGIALGQLVIAAKRRELGKI